MFRSDTAHRPARSLPWLVPMLLLSWVALAQAAMHPNDREGWLIGLGIGGGGLQVSDQGASSDRESGVAASLRAGYAFSPQVSLELDGTLWSREDNGTRFTFSATGATINVYPGASGFVLRAGVGGGTGEVQVQQGNVTITASENGLGLLAGLGYEFRVARKFAFGPQAHFGWADLDSFNADWFTLELGATWYFLKQ